MRMISRVLSLATLSLSVHVLCAQQTGPALGFDPNGVFHSSSVDNVNLTNGNVVFKIPLFSLPQRGAFKPITVYLAANTEAWTISPQCSDQYHCTYQVQHTDPLGWGVNVTSDIPFAANSYSPPATEFNDGATYDKRFMTPSFGDEIGTNHPAVYDASDATTVRSVDGSGFMAKSPAGYNSYDPWYNLKTYGTGVPTGSHLYPPAPVTPVYTREGIATQSVLDTWHSAPPFSASPYNRISGLVDPDGNTITFRSPLYEDGLGQPYIDTIGRRIYPDVINYSGNFTADDPEHPRCPNLNVAGQVATQYAVHSFVDTYGAPPTSSDARYTYTFCYATINFHTGTFGGTNSYQTFYWGTEPGQDGYVGLFELTGSAYMLQSVIRPDGTYWGFVYDSVADPVADPTTIAMGTLTKIILPTGGAVSYCYNNAYTYQIGVGIQGTVLAPTLPLITRRLEQTSAGTNADACGATSGYSSYSITPIPPQAYINGSATVTDPAGNQSTRVFGLLGDTVEDFYDGSTVVKEVQNTYGAAAFLPQPSTYSNFYPMVGSITDQVTLLDQTSGGTHSLGSVGHQTSQYAGGFSGNTWVCDLYPFAPYGNCGSTPAAAYLAGQLADTTTWDAAGAPLSETHNYYEAYPGSSFWPLNMLDLKHEVSTGDLTSSHVVDYTHDSLGHLTQTNDGGYISQNVWRTSAPTGLIDHQIDPRGTTSATYTYDTTNYTSGGVTYYAGLEPISVTNPIGAEYFSYDRLTIDPLSHTDLNGHTTTVTYDVMRRPWTVQYPDAFAISSSGQSKVACYTSKTQVQVYQATTTVLTATLPGSGIADAGACPTSSADAILTTENVDGLSRVSSTILRAPEGNIETDTTYDNMDRVSTVSNPYIGTPTGFGTTTTYDALGRPVSVTEQDSSVKSLAYSGLDTTSTDEALNMTTTTADFSGRTVRVQEPTANNSTSGMLDTHYQYNIFGLIGVDQYGNGSETHRIRKFSYDSIGRLTNVCNPEGLPSGQSCDGSHWSMTYAYLNSSSALCAGDLSLPCLKTDSRSVATSYSYDNMNRLIWKYHGVDAEIDAYSYDGKDETGSSMGAPWTSNAMGRLSHTSNEFNAASNYQYDSMGRVILKKDCLPGTCNYSDPQSATYDLAGHITSQSYPNGLALNQVFDSAGRLTQVSQGSVNYLSTPAPALPSVFAYWPNGSPHTYIYGSGVTENFTQNSRLQTTALTAANSSATLMSRTYSYAPSDGLSGSCATTSGNRNTGNIWKITDNLNSNWTRQFQYDCMDRLSSAAMNSTTYGYWLDPFGNMSPVLGGSAVNTFAANNRISNLPCHTSGGLADYDNAGNQLCDTDPSGANRIYTYDAEERIASIATSASPTSPFASYIYSPEGDRVHKANADLTWTDYARFNGQITAEQDQDGHWTDYIYAGDKKIAKVLSPQVVHLSGSVVAGSGSVAEGIDLTGLNGVTFQSGDVLTFWQYTVAENGQNGGIFMSFTSGDFSTSGAHGWIVDQDGHSANQDTTYGLWHKRIIDLSTFSGLTVNRFLLLNERTGATGQYDEYYADLAVRRSDGSVIPLWTGSPAAGTLGATVLGPGSATAYADGNLPASTDSSAQGTHYYLDDHLGTAQYELSALGWPVWYGQFTPYGQEITSDATTFKYKFTGKERDAESGLDYFGARYYGNTINVPISGGGIAHLDMGRWMNPDWADKPEVVPYSALGDPQSLNLYAYVRNHPVNQVDADGHIGLRDVEEFATAAMNAYSSDVSVGVVRAQEQTTTAGFLGALTGHVAAGIQSIEETGAGIASIGGGAAVCATGVGCLAGAPAIGVGAVATAHGVGTFGVAVGYIVAMGRGSYVNTHQSGKTYTGKGDAGRAKRSAARIEKTEKDAHVSTEHTTAANDRESFKDESRKLQDTGGAGSDKNYNKIDSPGTKYRAQDGSN